MEDKTKMQTENISNSNEINNKDNLKEENNIQNKENNKISPITKNSSLSPDLFSFPYISEYKCILCGLIPSPETANEEIDTGILYCDECLKKKLSEKKECKESEIKEKKYRKIKDENKIFYKVFKNLNIKCPYKCEWKGIWVDLDNHLNECKYGIRYCKYKIIGCEFYDDNKKIIEHEKNNDKYHLDMALQYIKKNNIVKKKIKFEMGETCKTSVHPHIMTYMTTISWFCDGRKLPHGCYSINYSFNSSTPRFRCNQCDFDLCDECIVHYLV